MLNYFKKLAVTTRRAVGVEFGLFRRFPRLGLAALAVSLVPAVYALIYLSSVWDPNAKTSSLPVGLVNLDQGLTFEGKTVNVGADLRKSLVEKGSFGFLPFADEAAVRSQVQVGNLAFAVVIPAEFSEVAVPGASVGGGKVKIILSEGNNYSAAGFAKRFAAELGHQVNETLNEKRWSLVLTTIDDSGKSLTSLKSGVEQISNGAVALRDGAAKYSEAAKQVSGGFKQVGGGIRTLESKWPADADLQAFKGGVQTLAAGQRELTKGLDQLYGGSQKVGDGLVQMRDQTANVPLVGAKVSKGAGELAAGNAQIIDGLQKAKDASGQLATGAGQLDTGASKLVEGVGALGEGVKTLSSKLPADDKLDAFADGGKAMAEGSAKLQAGIQLLYTSLPKSITKMEGSAKGLADSVEPSLEILSPVPNNGNAFVPNMVSIALWIGAVMTAYLFNLRALTTEVSTFPRFAKVMGKLSAPSAVVSLQVIVTSLVLVFGLGVVVTNYATFVITMLTASLVFLAMVFALLRVFGEAGKLLAVLLLTLQLAAGGGIMPI